MVEEPTSNQEEFQETSVVLYKTIIFNYCLVLHTWSRV